MRSLAILAVAAMALMPLGASAQRAAVPIINYENVALQGPDGNVPTAEQVKQAILSAAVSKQWEVREEGPGRMLATLHVRGKHTVMTDITYAPGTFSMKYRDSVNMKYGAGSDGKGVIHPFYNRWVQDFKEAVRVSSIKP